MIIQIGHSHEYDFIHELYEPIKQSDLYKNHQVIFPHEEWNSWINSEESLKKVELFVAEISHSSTGLGIELWFAKAYKLPIVCIHKKWITISSSIDYLTNNIHEYSNSEELITCIEEGISNIHEKQ